MSDIVFRSGREPTRARLEEVVPLSTPFQLVIDSTNLCDFACKFCPTGHPDMLKGVNRPRGLMDFDLWCKIVDDMKQFDRKLRRVDFGKDGEPLLHPRIVDMIQYVKQANVTDSCSIATNAKRLTPSMADALVDAGLDLLKISVEAVSDAGYKEITGRNVNYAQLLESVRYIYSRRRQCKIYAKIIDYGLSEDQKRKFYEDFESISDYITVDYVSGWSVTSVFDLKLGYEHDHYLDLPHLNKKDVCPLPFFTLSINFNGTVSICCVDWSMSTLVGDLRSESLQDLWNGERLFEFRKMQLRRAGYTNKACQECYAINGSLDNIDPYAEQILQRLIAERARARGYAEAVLGKDPA